MEGKTSRNISGPKREESVWRIRSNLELQNAYKSPDTVIGITKAYHQSGVYLYTKNYTKH
jgi:hypothetical protein